MFYVKHSPRPAQSCRKSHLLLHLIYVNHRIFCIRGDSFDHSQEARRLTQERSLKQEAGNVVAEVRI